MNNQQFKWHFYASMVPLSTITTVLTAVVILVALILPKQDLTDVTPYMVLLLILVGVVHGASDFFIYQSLQSQLSEQQRTIRFNLLYFSVLALYALIWHLFPSFAVVVFFSFSIYHFGQSNWYQYKLTNHLLNTLIYLSWGAFVLLTPILIHLETSNEHLAEISSIQLHVSVNLQWSILSLLLLVNAWIIFHLRANGSLNATSFLKEISNLVILFILFISTPAVLGFAIYFAVWHSTYSTAEQIKLLRQREQDFCLKSYCQSLASMSGLAFLGLGLMYWLFTQVLHLSFGWGMLFLSISLVTIPHTYIIDRIYKA